MTKEDTIRKAFDMGKAAAETSQLIESGPAPASWIAIHVGGTILSFFATIICSMLAIKYGLTYAIPIPILFVIMFASLFSMTRSAVLEQENLKTKKQEHINECRDATVKQLL